MTAVQPPRTVSGAAPDAGADGARPDGASGEPGLGRPGVRRPGPRRVHLQVGVGVVLLCMVLGGVGAGLAALAAPGRYQSTATVVFTATDLKKSGDTSAGSRFVQDRAASWASVASSDAISTRAAALGREPGGRPFDPSTVAVTGTNLSGTEIVRVQVTSAERAAVPAEATYAARALAEIVTESERYPGLPLSRVDGRVTSSGTAALDVGLENAQWWGVLGIVAGFVVGLGACSLLRPGRWARDIAPVSTASRGEAVAVNVSAMGDELRTLVHGLRTPAGRVTAGLAVVSIVGYGFTGSMVFPLAVVVAAGVWSWRARDARWSTAALLFVTIGVFPEKVDVIRLGPVTPTVLEAALVVALVLAVRFAGPRPRSVFAAPVLAIAAAAVLGGAIAIARGGDFTSMIDGVRAILVVLGFFPVYFAFGRRPHQLVAVLLAVAGTSSAFILLAAVTGWSRLLVDERTSVITGTATASVSRLSSPVLDLWAPMLVLLLSALVPRRPRWLFLGLVVIGVMHQALSYNRSTWVPLIVLVVAVAAVTHGRRGLVRRALVLLVVGGIGLGLAFSGALGTQGRAVADRATSVITSRAYGEDSLPDRQRENGAALNTLQGSPWVGTGVGQPYGGELITYDGGHSRTVVDNRPYIHNQYLRIWLFMGLLGLLAYAFAGVRIGALVVHSWWRRTAAWPMVVVMGMGLSCLAAQAILQTTLVARSNVLTTVTLMAAAAGFAAWSPPGTPPRTPRPSAPSPASARPRSPAPAAGTMEE